jgi:hypothetical protein
MATSVTKGGTQKLPKILRMSKPTDMTIHWPFLKSIVLHDKLNIYCLRRALDLLFVPTATDYWQGIPVYADSSVSIFNWGER